MRTFLVISGFVLLTLVGCGGDDGEPSCSCLVMPAGADAISAACGTTGCFGGEGYRCTGDGRLEDEPAACPVDSGVAEDAAETCSPSTCRSGCCSEDGVCVAGRDHDACGSNGLACGSCGPGETCSAAAGACVLDAPAGCSVIDMGGYALDDCVGDTICDCGPGQPVCEETGSCVGAALLTYRAGISWVEVPVTKPDGTAWDVVGGAAPELYVEIQANTISIATSSPGPEDFAISFVPGPFIAEPIVYSPGFTTVEAHVWDEDSVVDDGAFVCTWELTPALLRRRDLSCSGSLGTIRGLIIPMP